MAHQFRYWSKSADLDRPLGRAPTAHGSTRPIALCGGRGPVSIDVVSVAVVVPPDPVSVQVFVAVDRIQVSFSGWLPTSLPPNRTMPLPSSQAMRVSVRGEGDVTGVTLLQDGPAGS